MLSILIPVFNVEVGVLVSDLARQCQKLGIIYEIWCFDDASDAAFVELLKKIEPSGALKIRFLSQNVGRAKIRNQLGAAAQFNYLLFLDCDVSVAHAPDFIAKYIAKINTENQIIVGGICYQPNVPPLEKRLHWSYGRQRENQSEAQHFLSSNFLIRKTTFDQLKFDENITQYGHEDTLFGIEATQRGFKMAHINNPVQHDGLENADVFLKKTALAIENLIRLRGELGKNKLVTKLVKVDIILRRYYLRKLAFYALSIFSNGLKRYLLRAKHPKIIVLDCYKLWIYLKQKQHSK